MAFVLDAHHELAPYGIVGELYVEESSLDVLAGSSARDAASRLLPDPFATRPGARRFRTGLLARECAVACSKCTRRRDA